MPFELLPWPLGETAFQVRLLNDLDDLVWLIGRFSFVLQM